jgi:hypothetical protein
MPEVSLSAILDQVMWGVVRASGMASSVVDAAGGGWQKVRMLIGRAR